MLQTPGGGQMTVLNRLFATIFGQACMPERVDDVHDCDLDSLEPGDDWNVALGENDQAGCIEEPLQSKNKGPGPLTEALGMGVTAVRPVQLSTMKNLAISSSQKQAITIDFTALRDPDWQCRLRAVAGLRVYRLGSHPGDFNQEAANLILPAVRAALRDERSEVRAQATICLGDLGGEAVWLSSAVLWEACSDPDESVRRAALQVLESYGQQTPPEHLRQPRLWSRPWQEPPSLQAVREDPQEDCHSDAASHEEDMSTAAGSGYSSRKSIFEDVSTAGGSGHSSRQSSRISSRSFQTQL